MKIVLDEIKKEGVLLKNDGTEVSRYSFEGILNNGYTLEDFKRDNEDFNTTLAQHEEFDNIEDLSTVIDMHSWK